MHQRLKRIYIEIGTGAEVVVYDIVSNTLEHDICEALPGLHSFSGSDTTSFFSGIGKTKCLSVMKTLEEWIDCMQMLGSNQKLDSVSIEKLEAFTCMLYNCKETRSIDEARYKQFCWKKKLPDPHKLPPTSDALTLHLRRANYEAFEWKQALLLDHQFTDPQGNGWKKINDTLEIEWTSQPSGPEKILDFITCKCKKTSCKKNVCNCRKSKLPCSGLCECLLCENNEVNEDIKDEYAESEDSTDDDFDESDAEY